MFAAHIFLIFIFLQASQMNSSKISPSKVGTGQQTVSEEADADGVA